MLVRDVPGKVFLLADSPFTSTLRVRTHLEHARLLCSVALTFVVALVVVLPVDAVEIRAGSEFQVNAYTTGEQQPTSMTGDSDGNFTVVWRGRTSGVFLQRYDSHGTRIGTEVMINTPGQFTQDGRICASADGRYVVTWTQDILSRSNIWGRTFSSDGTLSPQFLINSSTVDEQHSADVDCHPDGSFVVVWSDDNDVGMSASVRGQRYDSDALALGTEFIVTQDSRTRGRIQTLSNGGFVVTWRPYRADEVLAQLYSSDGLKVGTEILVNESTGTAGGAQPVDLGSSSDAFVATWLKDDGGASARVFDLSGNALSSEVPVAPAAGAGGAAPVTHMFTDSSFVVAWTNSYLDGHSVGVRAGKFSSTGQPMGSSFQVNSYRPHGQVGKAIVGDADGDFVVVYRSGSPQEETSTVQDGSLGGVYGQRFCDSASTDCDLCPGFDDSADADGDGVPDGCDPCTNVEDARAMTSAKLKIKRLTRSVTGNQLRDRIRFKGRMTLPAVVPFTSLDPATEGARLVIVSQDGDPVLDAPITAGGFGGAASSGWSLDDSGTPWRFRDKTGVPPYGITKFLLKDKRGTGAGAVGISLIARLGRYPIKADDPPVRLSLTLGNNATANAGGCGEIDFATDECRLDASMRSLSCKR